MGTEKAVEITIDELLEIRSALHQCRDMLVGHERDIGALMRRLEQEREDSSLAAADLRLVQKEISDLKAIAAENRKSIQNIFIGSILAVITAYFSKYIK